MSESVALTDEDIAAWVGRMYEACDVRIGIEDGHLQSLADVLDYVCRRAAYLEGELKAAGVRLAGSPPGAGVQPFRARLIADRAPAQRDGPWVIVRTEPAGTFVRMRWEDAAAAWQAQPCLAWCPAPEPPFVAGR